MSNDDSNEQGNAAAGQTAFQVGDRVRFDWFGSERSGVIVRLHKQGGVDVSDLEGVYSDRYGYTVAASALTLISRATPAPTQTVDEVDEGEQYDGQYVTEPQTRERYRVPQVCRDCAWDGLAPYTVEGDFLPINGWRICKRCNAINGPYPLTRMCIACMGTGRVEGSLCVSCRGTGIDPQHRAAARGLMTDQEAANAAVPHAEPDVDDMPYPDGDWYGPDSDVPGYEGDDPDDVAVDSDDWQRTPPEPATPAPATPVPFTALQRALNAMDSTVATAERFNGVEVVTEALEAIRQAVHALAAQQQGGK